MHPLGEDGDVSWVSQSVVPGDDRISHARAAGGPRLMDGDTGVLELRDSRRMTYSALTVGLVLLCGLQGTLSHPISSSFNLLGGMESGHHRPGCDGGRGPAREGTSPGATARTDTVGGVACAEFRPVLLNTREEATAVR